MVWRTLLSLLLLATVVVVPAAGRATPPPPDLVGPDIAPFDVDSELQRIQQLVDEQRYPEALNALDALLARDVLDAGQLAIATSLRSLVEKAMGLEWAQLERQREREREQAERRAERERQRQRAKERSQRLAREFRDRQLDRDGRWLRLETGLHSGAYLYDAEPADGGDRMRRLPGSPVEGEVSGAKLSLDLRAQLSPVELWVLEGRMDVAPYGAWRDLETTDDVVITRVQGPVGAYRSSIRSGVRVPAKHLDWTVFAGYQHDRVATYVVDSDADDGVARQVRPAHQFAVGTQLRTRFDVHRKAVRELGFSFDLGLAFGPPVVLDGVARRTFGLDGEYGLHVQLEHDFLLGMRLRVSGSFHRYLVADPDGELVPSGSDPDVSEMHLGYGFFVGFAV